MLQLIPVAVFAKPFDENYTTKNYVDPTTSTSPETDDSDEDVKDPQPSTTDTSPQPSVTIGSSLDKPVAFQYPSSSVVKYAPVLTLAEEKDPILPEIRCTYEGNTLQIMLSSFEDSSSTQVSVLGQRCAVNSGIIQVSLPPVAQSLTYVLVIVTHNDVSYARYIPLTDSSSSTSRDEKQNARSVLDYFQNTE